MSVGHFENMKSVRGRTILERFEEKFVKTDGCWVWIGAISSSGYGNFSNKTAHRVSYELYVGKIPAGMYVCHTCDNPSCVNPKHLFAGTAAENNVDRDKKGRARNGLNPKGEGSPHATITAETALKVRAMAMIPMRKIDIARSLGLSQHIVYDICLRRTWNYV